jgi:hypothetical protein
MKRIRLILTSLSDMEMLTLEGSPNVLVCASRFVIDDRREGSMVRSQVLESGKTGSIGKK